MAYLIMNGINLGPKIKVDVLPTTNINEHAIYEVCRNTLTKENPIGPSVAVGVFTTDDHVAGTYCTVDLTVGNAPGEPLQGWYLNYPGSESNVYWEYAKNIVAEYLMNYDGTVTKGGWTFNCNDFIIPDVEGEPDDYCFVTLWNQIENKLEIYGRTKDFDGMYNKFNKVIYEYYYYDVVNEEWIRIDKATVMIGSTDVDDGQVGVAPEPKKAYVSQPLLSNATYDSPNVLMAGHADTPVSDEVFAPFIGLPFRSCSYTSIATTKVNPFYYHDLDSDRCIEGTLITIIKAFSDKFMVSQLFTAPEKNIRIMRHLCDTYRSYSTDVITADLVEYIKGRFTGGYMETYWRNLNNDCFVYGNSHDGEVLPASKQRYIVTDPLHTDSLNLYLSEWLHSWHSGIDKGSVYSNIWLNGVNKNIGERMFIPHDQDYCSYTTVVTKMNESYADDYTVHNLTRVENQGRSYIFPKNYKNFMNVDAVPEHPIDDMLYIVHE